MQKRRRWRFAWKVPLCQMCWWSSVTTSQFPDPHCCEAVISLPLQSDASGVFSHCVAFEKSLVTHRLKPPIVQDFINSVRSLEILSGITLCVSVTQFAEGRKKLCRHTYDGVERWCPGQRSCKNQDMSARRLHACAWLSAHEADDSGFRGLFPVSLPV